MGDSARLNRWRYAARGICSVRSCVMILVARLGHVLQVMRNFADGTVGSIAAIFAYLVDVLRNSLMFLFLIRFLISCRTAALLAGKVAARIPVLVPLLFWFPSAALLASLSTLSLSGMSSWLGIHRYLMMIFGCRLVTAACF